MPWGGETWKGAASLPTGLSTPAPAREAPACCRLSFVSRCHFTGLTSPSGDCEFFLLLFPFSPSSPTPVSTHLPPARRCQTADVPPGRAERAYVRGEHSLREIIDFGSASYEIWGRKQVKICYFTTLILLTSLEINIHITAWRNQMLHLMERQGWERGAVVASHGSAEYYKAPLPSGDAWEGCAGCWVIPKQMGNSPVFPVFLPSRCWGLRGDARAAMLVVLVRRWMCSEGGLEGGCPLGGLQDLRE